MDKNEDGVLDYNEMEADQILQGERDKYDADHNGVIDLTEYKAYDSARRGGSDGRDPGIGRRPAEDPKGGDEEERKRPTLIRAGNMPKDFPYANLDLDQVKPDV